MCATPPGTHRLSSLPRDTQQWPSQPGRNSRNGQVAGAGSWGVDSSRNQGRNKIKRSWQENTIPAVSERARRLQVPSCLRVNEGQLRPRLADARYLTRSRGAAWLGGHLVAWVPTHSPTAVSGGPETIPSLPLSFFTSLAFASQHKPHSTGSRREQSPQSAPRPAAILERGRRYF